MVNLKLENYSYKIQKQIIVLHVHNIIGLITETIMKEFCISNIDYYDAKSLARKYSYRLNRAGVWYLH